MEQVFDLREFIVGIFKKFKLVIILSVVFAVAGGVFGYASFPNDDKIQSTSTAAISLIDKQQNSTALESAMKMINSYVTSDTFYTALLNELSTEMQSANLGGLFGGDATPKMTDVKEILKIFSKGNIIVSEVTSTDPSLSLQAAELCNLYIIENVPKFNDTVAAIKLGNETVNITSQNNDSALKEALKFAILGLGGGIVLSILFIFFVDILDLRVKKKSDLKRFNIPVLSDNMDRTVAIIAVSLKQEQKQVIALTSSSDKLKTDIKAIASCLQDSLKRVGIEAKVIDTRGKSGHSISADFVTELYTAVNDTIIVCCDCINDSTDAMYYIGGATGVILCEEKKLSRTDDIGGAVEIIDNLKMHKMGILLM